MAKLKWKKADEGAVSNKTPTGRYVIVRDANPNWGWYVMLIQNKRTGVIGMRLRSLAIAKKYCQDVEDSL